MNEQELLERLEATEKRLAERERGDLQRKVAQKYNIPLELATMIKGNTEAEMAADTRILAKHLAPKAPDTEAGKGSQAAQGAHKAPEIAYKFGKGDVTPWPSPGAGGESR